MAFTIQQYEALKSAIATGTQTVSYGDKTVTYRSLAEMKEVLRIMENELFPNRVTPRRRYAYFDRGFFK